MQVAGLSDGFAGVGVRPKFAAIPEITEEDEESGQRRPGGDTSSVILVFQSEKVLFNQ